MNQRHGEITALGHILNFFGIFANSGMATMFKKIKWKRLLKIIAVIYVACGIALYFLQENFLFHPDKLSADAKYEFDYPFKEVTIPVTNEKNLSIVQFSVPDSIRKGVVLYFHGNRGNIRRYRRFVPVFTRNNYEVWMIDYPGYGKTTGTMNEKAMEEDAEQFYKLARSRFSKDSIIIYGKSLGSGPACYLAARSDCKKLILETPYYSIPKLMQRYAPIYPIGLMAKYFFPNYQCLEKVEAPVTFFHGTGDKIIPYFHSEMLAKIPKHGSELITIKEGTHLNLDSYELFNHKMDSLLKE